MPLTRYPNGIFASPVIGSGTLGLFSGLASANSATNGKGNIFFVDGDNGNDGNDGLDPENAKQTIQGALNVAAAGAVVFVKARKIAAAGTDPVSYAETLTISASQAGLALIGVANGPKQAAQPQIKKNAGSTALLTIRAPGCLVYGLTFNGINSTGGGILLDDDSATKTCEGTIIQNCVFKNCVGSGATDGSSGGAIVVAGGSWDSLIKDCVFFKNIGGIVLNSAGGSKPQDITIENCKFNSVAAADRDCDIWGKGSGTGVDTLEVRNCTFGIYPNAGTKNTYMDLTACNGLVSGCRFGCTSKTFKAAGDVKIPLTVLISGNWAEDGLKGRDA